MKCPFCNAKASVRSNGLPGDKARFWAQCDNRQECDFAAPLCKSAVEAEHTWGLLASLIKGEGLTPTDSDIQ